MTTGVSVKIMERANQVKKYIIYQMHVKFSRARRQRKKLTVTGIACAATHLNIWYPPVVHLQPTDDAQRAHRFVHRRLPQAPRRSLETQHGSS